MKTTVLLPVYNGRRYLREAVESLLNEGLKDLEIIVLDDGSTDGSLESIADMAVRRERSSVNRGIGATLNWGLTLAQGEAITFMDADDKLAPGGLKWRIDYLEKNPEVQAVGGRPAGIIGEAGEALTQYPHLLHPDYHPPKLLTFDFVKNGGLFPLSILLFLYRKSLFETVGRFREDLRSAQDCDIMLKMLKLTNIPIVFEPVFYRRLHSDNHSHALEGGERALQARTIREVKEVFSSFGMELGDEFNLWEWGYMPAGKTENSKPSALG